MGNNIFKDTEREEKAWRIPDMISRKSFFKNSETYLKSEKFLINIVSFLKIHKNSVI